MNVALNKSLLLFWITITLVACGGGGADSNDDAADNTCREAFSCPSGGTVGGFLEWLSGTCTTSTVCSSDQVKNPWELGTQEETEPNNSLQEALPVFAEEFTPFLPDEEQPPIVNILGSVSPTDVVDYVAFSTDSPRTITIYICETTNLCGSSTYSGDAVYLDVLDANGSIIASTAASLGPRGHEIIMSYTPGLVYFVRIVNDNLTVGEFDYRFVILVGTRS